jgi:hypothetical protein
VRQEVLVRMRIHVRPYVPIVNWDLISTANRRAPTRRRGLPESDPLDIFQDQI